LKAEGKAPAIPEWNGGLVRFLFLLRMLLSSFFICKAKNTSYYFLSNIYFKIKKLAIGVVLTI
jgi:hypothetical protein